MLRNFGLLTMMLVLTGLQFGGIDAHADTGNETGSITLHKIEGDGGEEADGLLSDYADRFTPISKVRFTLAKLGEVSDGGCVALPSSTTDVEVDANGSPNFEKYCSIPVADGVTDEHGEIEWTGLDLGVYVVEEVEAPAHVVSKVAPFLVSLPLYNADRGFLHDVHIYPKNITVDAPVKTVFKPADLLLGSEVRWEISALVPSSESLSKFEVVDELDARLAFKESAVSLVSGAESGSLVEGDDYLVELDGSVITWRFTDGGLEKLAEGAEVRVELFTTVEALYADGLTDGEVFNSAVVFVNDARLETDVVQSNWGELGVEKIDAETGEALSGARFRVFEPVDGECRADGETLEERITDDNGELVFSLWVGNNTETSKAYCLEELEAPAGYVLPNDTIQKVLVQSGASVKTVVTVENTPEAPEVIDPPSEEMEVTGVQIAGVGVAALLLVAAGVVIRSRRANE